MLKCQYRQKTQIEEMCGAHHVEIMGKNRDFARSKEHIPEMCSLYLCAGIRHMEVHVGNYVGGHVGKCALFDHMLGIMLENVLGIEFLEICFDYIDTILLYCFKSTDHMISFNYGYQTTELSKLSLNCIFGTEISRNMPKLFPNCCRTHPDSHIAINVSHHFVANNAERSFNNGVCLCLEQIML